MNVMTPVSLEGVDLGGIFGGPNVVIWKMIAKLVFNQIFGLCHWLGVYVDVYPDEMARMILLLKCWIDMEKNQE